MYYDFKNKAFKDVALNGGKLAISGSDNDLNWDELYRIVSNLSAFLKNNINKQNNPILIYGHKEAAYAATILSCIHSSITYIPVDAIYPKERICKIITISNAKTVLNCSKEHLQLDNINVVNVLDIFKDHAPLINSCNNDYIQYIMFTSGSTGAPKGVQISYSSINSFLSWATQSFGYNSDDVFMNQAPFTFDVSLCDLLLSFSLGASLVLNSSFETKDQTSFINKLMKYKCTVWTSTPSFVYLFLRNESFNFETLPYIRSFLFMGENLPVNSCKVLRAKFPNSVLSNAYGPTEATIVTTHINLTDEIINSGKIPIGFPKDGNSIELINQNEGIGEIVIIGDHVSNGYVNQQEKNDQLFQIKNGKRAYKTGDLGYFENEMLYYLGRNDEQVKLHGFRIELNEINQIILKSNGNVVDACTIPLTRNDNVIKLLSFVKVIEENNKPDLIEKINKYLKLHLPYYMVPAEIVIVNEFPFTDSHKIDKKKLLDNYLSTL